MAIIDPVELGLGEEVRGTIGASSKYGDREYGNFEYGAGGDVGGVYRVRSYNGRRIQERMNYYTPANPQTESQQAWRAVFASAVSAWQGLSENAKEAYRVLAKYKPLSGFNLFVKEYLLSH